MGIQMITTDPRFYRDETSGKNELIEPPQRNLVKDGPRELLKQRIEKMQMRAAEKTALKNVNQLEEYFLKLAQQYFHFSTDEYRGLPREEKEALFELVRSKAQKRMRFVLGGNGIFLGGVFLLSSIISPFFFLSLPLLVLNIPIMCGGLEGEIDFLAYKRYAPLLFSRNDKKGDGV